MFLEIKTVSLKPLEIQLLIFVLNLHLITKVLDMSYKTRRILFFVTTIFVFENISQAKYLLVEIDGEPKVGGRSFDSRVSLDGLWPVNLTTDAASETDFDSKPKGKPKIATARPLQLEYDLTGTYF